MCHAGPTARQKDKDTSSAEELRGRTPGASRAPERRGHLAPPGRAVKRAVFHGRIRIISRLPDGTSSTLRKPQAAFPTENKFRLRGTFCDPDRELLELRRTMLPRTCPRH